MIKMQRIRMTMPRSQFDKVGDDEKYIITDSILKEIGGAPTGLANCINNAVFLYGIKSIDDLKELVDSGKILRVRNMGKKYLRELRERLGMELEPLKSHIIKSQKLKCPHCGVELYASQLKKIEP